MNVREGIRGIDSYIHGYCGEAKSWVIVDESSETNVEWGKLPWERSLGELLSASVLNVDKPPGPTSHEVVAWIKRMLDVGRAGHGGTLEVLA